MLAKFKKNKKKIESTKNTLFLIFLALVFFGFLTFSIYSNIKISQRRNQYLRQIEDLKEKIKAAEKEKENLEKNLNRAESKEYLEEIARKQFGLKAQGEEVVVVSREEEDKEKPIENSKKTDIKMSVWNPRTWWNWLMNR